MNTQPAMKKIEAVTLEQIIRFDDLLTEDQIMMRDSVRSFVRTKFLPVVEKHFNAETFPSELIPEIASMGLLGAGLEGYGCAGLDPISYGLVLHELEYGDGGLRSFVSVQGSLAMFAIWKFGSEEQKKKWLPEMAAGRVLGCFGLTEPDAGSDPGAMRTRAEKIPGGYRISGAKMWITSSPVSKVAVVWAKIGEGPDSIRGFIVERDRKGFATPHTKNKYSLRASVTGEITLDKVEVPEENLLPLSKGLGSPLACLNNARYGISWGVCGAARACLDASIDYTKNRVAFGVPIAKKQLVQEKLVHMATGISTGMMLSWRAGKLKEEGKLTPYMVSMAKRHNCAMALEAARMSRALHGGNGIMAEYPVIRHMLNLESVYTYEGTHEVHTLILGRGLTGEDAF
ncbi:MAG: acyl-CoA dehydrogenase family protein [Planctomycetota bacterium]